MKDREYEITKMQKIRDDNNIFISVVIPIFNEEENLPILTDRLLSSLSRYNRFEIIYVNDGSVDNSKKIIEQLCDQNGSVKLIDFSRNFGHQSALSAGIKYAAGDAVIIMDGDLQDPPEVLPQFVEKWKEGYDVVYAIRKDRKENILKKSAYYIFYRLLDKVSDIAIPLDSGDFSIMDKKIVNHLNLFSEKNKFIRGIRAWVGFKQIGLTYERQSRLSGRSKYALTKLISLALDGIISFSRKPLLISSHLGIIITIISFLGILIVLYLKLFTSIFISGFAGIAILILFMGGIQLFLIGILGEYVGRVSDEVKNRPNFIVQSTKNLNIARTPACEDRDESTFPKG